MHDAVSLYWRGGDKRRRGRPQLLGKNILTKTIGRSTIEVVMTVVSLPSYLSQHFSHVENDEGVRRQRGRVEQRILLEALPGSRSVVFRVGEWRILSARDSKVIQSTNQQAVLPDGRDRPFSAFTPAPLANNRKSALSNTRIRESRLHRHQKA